LDRNADGLSVVAEDSGGGGGGGFDSFNAGAFQAVSNTRKLSRIDRALGANSDDSEVVTAKVANAEVATAEVVAAGDEADAKAAEVVRGATDPTLERTNALAKWQAARAALKQTPKPNRGGAWQKPQYRGGKGQTAQKSPAQSKSPAPAPAAPNMSLDDAASAANEGAFQAAPNTSKLSRMDSTLSVNSNDPAVTTDVAPPMRRMWDRQDTTDFLLDSPSKFDALESMAGAGSRPPSRGASRPASRPRGKLSEKDWGL
jgi:hypothetical protein